MNQLLPQIEVSPKLYTTLKIGFLIAVFAVITLNVLNNAHAMVQIVGGINGSAHAYPENYYNDTGTPNELIDDDFEESDESEDEQIHEEESREWKQH